MDTKFALVELHDAVLDECRVTAGGGVGLSFSHLSVFEQVAVDRYEVWSWSGIVRATRVEEVRIEKDLPSDVGVMDGGACDASGQAIRLLPGAPVENVRLSLTWPTGCTLRLVASSGGGSDGSNTAGSPGSGSGAGSLCDGTAAVTGCKMAWSGAVTGSGDCSAFGSDTSLLVGTPTANPFAALIVRDFGRTAVVGTYGLADVSDAVGGLSYVVNTYAYGLAKNTAGTVGSMELHLTSRDAQGNWHGFFRATAPGDFGNVGTVGALREVLIRTSPACDR